MRKPTLIVSACLFGRRCRYDGQSKGIEGLESLLQDWNIVAVCPEELGGLGTPRPPAELYEGDGARVLSGIAKVRQKESGRDVSAEFVSGARKARAEAPEARVALLKSRSPSCGCGQTHIDGAVVKGDGVFAALLRQEGLRLITDQELKEEGFV